MEVIMEERHPGHGIIALDMSIEWIGRLDQEQCSGQQEHIKRRSNHKPDRSTV